MRDRRFIAVHRGGPLGLENHRRLAAWASTCAQHVLDFFENTTADDRPRRAITAAKAWASGEISVGEAQRAAVAAHGAARDARNEAAIAAARAAGHAAATAHAPDHCLGPAIYGCKAVSADGGSADLERAWQLERAPADLRQLISSGLEAKEIRARRGPRRSSR